MSTADDRRSIAAYWDGQAATFDAEPDHGLTDPGTRQAWSSRLDAWLPPPPADVVDLGCGTASLSILLADRGHRVTGIDLAANMIERARSKVATAGLDIDLRQGDASTPDLPPASADVVLVRHLVWTLPDPYAAIQRWAALLRPGGRMVLIEGRWAIPAEEDPAPQTSRQHAAERFPWQGGARHRPLSRAVQRCGLQIELHDLSGEPALWGHPVDDERYAIVATLPGAVPARRRLASALARRPRADVTSAISEDWHDGIAPGDLAG